MFTHDTAEITDGGFAVVVVSAQAVGVHGFAGPNRLGLTAWDPERYGSLHIASDDASYGIFSATAALVGPARDPRSLDPLADLRVERIIATGSSQSAARLHTYWNAIHPLGTIFDAFLLDVHFGWSAPLTSPHDGRPTDLAGTVGAFRPVSMLRDDADIPMFVGNTETEALTFFPVRRPDTDLFRFWEAAGAAHAPLPSMLGVLEKFRRDWGVTIEAPTPATAPNDMDTTPLRDAAIHQMHRWLTRRIAPSSMPPIDLSAEPPRIRRDPTRDRAGWDPIASGCRAVGDTARFERHRIAGCRPQRIVRAVHRRNPANPVLPWPELPGPGRDGHRSRNEFGIPAGTRRHPHSRASRRQRRRLVDVERVVAQRDRIVTADAPGAP
jgi:hypothetical protein